MTIPRHRKRLAALSLALALAPTGLANAQGRAPRDVRITPDSPRQQPLPDVQPIPEPAELEDIPPRVDTDEPLLGSEISAEEARRIDQELIENINDLAEPGDRALTLIRAARYKTLLRDYPTALRALEGAGRAALLVTDPLTRDLRLIGAADGYLRLADELVDSSLADASYEEVFEGADPIGPEDRLGPLREAMSAYDAAARLAVEVERPTYNAETLYKIVERSAQSALELGTSLYIDSSRLANAEEARPELEALADRMLLDGVAHARLIRRPAWRDRALVAVAGAGASSKQFDRAFEVAGMIPNPEVRTEALLRIAESEARRGTPEGATRAYSAAARTIASIPIDDLRATLANVMVDSLIATGRFVDARRSIVLYPDDRRKVEALGAVAESMGARGLSDEAREWIEREVNPAYQGRLLRQVNDGVLRVLNRTRPDTFEGGPVR